MKYAIFKAANQLVAPSLRAAFRWRRQGKLRSTPSVVLMPPSPSGSLGDEAMVQAVHGILRERGIHHSLVNLGHRFEWDVGDMDTIDMLGWLNSYPDASPMAYLRIADHSHFFVLGADTMDGKYSDHRTLQRAAAARVATELGLGAGILGFSFNDSPTRSAVQALRSLPPSVRLYARDPVSRGRLENALQRSITQSADLAFLLKPDDDAQESIRVRDWSGRQRAEGRALLGINANAVHASKAGGESELVRLYAETINRIVGSAAEPTSVLLVPHDDRGEWSDVRLATEIRTAISPDVRSFVEQVQFPIRARAIKSIAGLLDAALTGRMHFAIATLGQGIPAAGLTYQGKFAGLYDLFELEGLAVDPSEQFDPDTLVRVASGMLRERDERKAQVQNRLPSIRELAMANFDLVLPAETV